MPHGGRRANSGRKSTAQINKARSILTNTMTDDQVAIVRGCVKWADRVYNLKRIPEQVNNAFQHAMSGKPGPTYLDFPGDILYAKIAEEEVDWSMSGRPILTIVFRQIHAAFSIALSRNIEQEVLFGVDPAAAAR